VLGTPAIWRTGTISEKADIVDQIRIIAKITELTTSYTVDRGQLTYTKPVDSLEFGTRKKQLRQTW
jgi:hypothetical protein